ncbi:hypothetical protein SAMN06265374_3446 [Roseibium denhamense]|uniref:Uncharacterized protein n=1 Tax=Roseibium denhamense TaxID=76305 RepID=A0ABY1PG39_9HYPH|nr:hypothetical protein SAMN06265374_3446 [Roseibium denhamense]
MRRWHPHFRRRSRDKRYPASGSLAVQRHALNHPSFSTPARAVSLASSCANSLSRCSINDTLASQEPLARVGILRFVVLCCVASMDAKGDGLAGPQPNNAPPFAVVGFPNYLRTFRTIAPPEQSGACGPSWMGGPNYHQGLLTCRRAVPRFLVNNWYLWNLGVANNADRGVPNLCPQGSGL